MVSRNPRPVYSDGKVHVMSEKCDTCIFRPGNLMMLASGRVKQMVDGSISEGAGITCHKTIHGQRDQEATCRGFFDSYKDQVFAFRLAEKLGLIEEVAP